MEEDNSKDTRRGITRQQSQLDDGLSSIDHCCTINRKYLIPKMFYFFYFAGLGALLPYQPLFYKVLGIPAKKAGIMSGVQPFISFLFTPMWGAIADKFKKGKLIFTISFVALTAVGIAYLLTPMPSCNVEIGKDSRREIMIGLNHSIFSRIFQTIARSQKINSWPVNIEDREENLVTLIINQQGNEKTFNAFLYLFFVSLFGTILSCPGLALGDAAAVALLRENNDVHKYGKQKKWASIGWGLAAFSFGALVSDKYLCPFIPGQKARIDYSLCFYGSIILKLLALFTGLQLDFDMNEDTVTDNKTNRVKQSGLYAAIRAVGERHYIAFFVTVLYSGMTFGMIMGFFFWHLEDCLAPQILFSIIPVVRCIADFIVYTISPRVITKIGLQNLIYLVLVVYVVRLSCYAFITSPWYFLPLEFLSGLTSAGGWAGFVAYIGYHTVEGAPATLQGKSLVYLS